MILGLKQLVKLFNLWNLICQEKKKFFFFKNSHLCFLVNLELSPLQKKKKIMARSISPTIVHEKTDNVKFKKKSIIFPVLQIILI